MTAPVFIGVIVAMVGASSSQGDIFKKSRHRLLVSVVIVSLARGVVLTRCELIDTFLTACLRVYRPGVTETTFLEALLM